MNYQGDDPNRQRRQGHEQQPQGHGQQGPGRQPRQQPQPPQQQPTGQRPPSQGQQQRPSLPAQPGPHQQSGPQGQPSQQQQAGALGPAGRSPQTQQQPGLQQSGQQQMGFPQQMSPQPRGQMGPQMGMQQQQRRMRRGPVKPLRADQLMSTDVITCQRDTPIRTIVAMMGEEDVGTVVAVDEDENRPIGILTDRKIALTLEETPDIANQEAEKLLDGDLVTGNTEMTIVDIIERMKDAEIRRLPIVDEDGSLQGVVSLDDVLIHLGDSLDSIGELIEEQVNR